MKFNFRKFFVLSICTLSLNCAFADQLSSEELSSNITTTIARVVIANESAEVAKVYADKDNRVLLISSNNQEDLSELIAAQENGDEVALTISKDLINNDLSNVITNVEVVQYGDKQNKPQMSYERRAFRTITAKDSYDLRRMFNSYYPYKSDYYDVDDNCYNRAHYWARTLQYQETNDTKNFGTKKIFILFSDAYQTTYDHKWWYHVAPVVNLQSSSKPHVLDSTFIDEPVTVKGWLETFDGHTDGNCKQISSLDEYYNETKPICMYIISDMYSYVPTDLGYSKPVYWRCNDFSKTNGVRSFTAPGKKTTNKRASWDDAEFSYLVPADCQ